MKDYALIIVDGTTSEGIVGRLVDPELADEAWPTVEARFKKPGRDRDLKWNEQRDLDESTAARRMEFETVRAGIQKSSMIRLEYARGAWDPKLKAGFLAAYGAAVVCGPEATAGVLALAREIAPPPNEDEELYRFSYTHFTRPFARRIGELADPGFDPEKDFGPHLLTAGIYEHECAENEARHQPHEGLLYVHGPDQAIVLDHHGAYMFYADGTSYDDVGLRGIPKQPGVYYFTGKPWGYGPDIDGECDSGLDIDHCVAATSEHYAKFGRTAADYAGEIEEFEAELEPIENASASPSI